MTWQCHMGWPHIVREYFPDVSDAQAWDILWMLGYPSFNTPSNCARVMCCRSKLAQMAEANERPMGCTR